MNGFGATYGRSWENHSPLSFSGGTAAGFLGGQSPPTCLKIESDNISASYLVFGVMLTGSTGTGSGTEAGVDVTAAGRSCFSARSRSSDSMRLASSSLRLASWSFRFLSVAFSAKKASSLEIRSLISWLVDTAVGIAGAVGVAVSVSNAVEVDEAVVVTEDVGFTADEVTDTVEVGGQVQVDTVAPCWAFAAVAVFREGVFFFSCVMSFRASTASKSEIKKKR